MNRNKINLLLVVIFLLIGSIATFAINKYTSETVEHHTLYDGTKVTKIFHWGKNGSLVYTIQDYKGKLSYRDKIMYKPGVVVDLDGTKYLKQEADFEHSKGKSIAKDVRYVVYSKDKEIIYAERDSNNDGNFDEKLYFKNNLVVKAEISSKKNGFFDRVEFHKNGNIVKGEYDSNGDGKADIWYYYDNGKFVRSEYDSDGDGKPDKEGVPPIYDKYKITYKMGGAR